MKKTAFFILILLSVFLLVSCIFDFGADPVNVTFLVNDRAGTVKTQAIVRGGTVLEPAVTYNGHTLIGWYECDSYTLNQETKKLTLKETGYKFDFSKSISKDLILVAHWNDGASAQKTVTKQTTTFALSGEKVTNSSDISFSTVNTPNGDAVSKTSVSIPEGALTSPFASEKESDVDLSITAYSISVSAVESSFTVSDETTKTAVAGIDCTLTIDGEEVSSFNNGQNVTVTTYIAKGLSNPVLKYKVSSDNYEFWICDKDKSKLSIPTAYGSDNAGIAYYDSTTGELIFKTSHFSTFYVEADVEAYIVETNTAYTTLDGAIAAVNNATTDSTLILLKDIYCSGTVTITSNWDTVIDFNGHTLAFNAEYDSKKDDKRGAFKLGNGHSLTLTDSSTSKTGKFTNTATTTSGNVYIVGVFSESNSSVIIDGLNVEMTSTSSSSGQIYGVVYSATNKKASENITIRNSQISLKSSTGTIVGALVEGSYVNTIDLDNICVKSEGSGTLVRINAEGPVINVKDSKFDMECPSTGKVLNISKCGAGSVVDNIEINMNANGSSDIAIYTNSNAVIENSEINATSTGAVKGIYISTTTEDGATIKNNNITVSSSSTSPSYTASGIYFNGDNHVIRDCTVVATNTGIEANAYALENQYYTAKNNEVQSGYYSGKLKGINVVDGYYSIDPAEWVIAGYTSIEGPDWYTIREATEEDVVCELTYTEDSQPIVEKFNSLTNAFARIDSIKQKEDMLLTVKKDCYSSQSSANIYCNIIIEDNANVYINSLSPKIAYPNGITIENNGTLNVASGLGSSNNYKVTLVNNDTLNFASSFTVYAGWNFTNNGTINCHSFNIMGGAADVNGTVTKGPGTFNNEGTVNISADSALTMNALTGYALNKTSDEVKATIYPVLLNNGSIVGTDDTSSMAVNFPITGTSSYDTGTYAWSTSDTAWVTGGRVLNVEKDLTYNLLSDAISDADKGQTLKILKSMSFGSGLEIAKNLTIDLNGNVLDFWNYTNVAGKAKAFTIKSATLTIDDSSTNHNGKITTTAGPAIWIQNNSSLILNNGIIENTGRGGSYSCVVFIAGYQNDEIGATNAHLVVNGGKIVASSEEWTDPSSGKYYPAGDGIYIFGHENTTDMPSITISGGEVAANGTVIVGQGSYNNTQITITGGKVESYENAAIYHPQYGQLSISGTAVVKGLSAICLKGGTLNISGGTLAATKTGTYAEPSAAIGSGTNITGDALYIEDNYNRGIVVNITGGTFSTVATGAQDWRVLFSGTTPAVVNDNRQQPN